MRFVECTLPHDKVMNFQNHNILLKTNFNKSSGNSKEDTFDIRIIIINNEGSGSRVNQAEKFKANQQEKFRAISTNIQSQLAKNKK